jgi:hypothetical protein
MPLAYTPALFDPPPGTDLKERGIGLALHNAGETFVSRACRLIQEVHAGQTILPEVWRETCAAQGITPHHPNAWGGLTHTLYKRGVIQPTDTFRPLRSSRSHGRLSRLWLVSPSAAPAP